MSSAVHPPNPTTPLPEPHHGIHDHEDHDGGGHGHGNHDHPGHHHGGPPPRGFETAFALGTGLNLLFVLLEVGFGLFSHSVALLADAAHNAGDVLSLALAWGAAVLERRRPTRRHTWGWGRSSILASLVNACILLVGVGAILVEALQRLGGAETPVGGTTVFAVALAGVAINGGTALLFLRARHGELNARGAYLHLASDTAVSLGVAVAGLVIAATGWTWPDPLTSIFIACFIAWASWGLLRDSFDLAMDAIPRGIEQGSIARYLGGLPGVIGIHDLHIWGLSTSRTALTAHLVRDVEALRTGDLVQEASEGLRSQFGIDHVTLQLEERSCDPPCTLSADDGR